MSEGQPQRALGALLLLIAVAGAAAPHAAAQDEAVFVHGESGGFVALEGETVLRLRGIQGTIALRTGKDGELRYEARALDDRRSERPVGLWLRGRAFEIVPLDQSSTERLLLEIAVSPGLAVELDLDDSNVQVAGLRSDFELRGARVDLDARGIYGHVSLDLVDSQVKLDGMAGRLDLEGTGLALAIDRVEGYATATLARSQGQIRGVTERAELFLEDSLINAAALNGGALVQASGGQLEIEGGEKEFDLRMEEASLGLASISGRMTIETDGEVRFKDLNVQLTLDGFGGAVRGSASSGMFEISTNHAEVALDTLNGRVTLKGDGLRVGLREMQGLVTVQTTSSDVRVEKSGGPLSIENEFGEIDVRDAAASVRVVSRDGNVRLSEIRAPVEVYASTERVEVGWSEIPAEGKQLVVNDAGDVVLDLPAGARCAVEVHSSAGEVTSTLPGVRVTDDRRYASGAIGGAREPRLEVRAQGNVELGGSAASAAEQRPIQ